MQNWKTELTNSLLIIEFCLIQCSILKTLIIITDYSTDIAISSDYTSCYWLVVLNTVACDKLWTTEKMSE